MIDKIKNHYIALTSSVDGKVVPFCPDNDEDDDNDIGNHRYYLFITLLPKRISSKDWCYAFR